MNDVNIICKKILYLLDIVHGDIFMMWGKYYISTALSKFPISTLTIMFICILCGGTYMSGGPTTNCFVEINSMQKR